MAGTGRRAFCWERAVQINQAAESSSTATPTDLAAAWIQQITRSGRVYQPPQAATVKKTPVEELKDDRVLEQLKKTQAHITIWGLLVASKPHRAALIKLLDESVISPDSTPEQLPGMIGSLTVQKSLAFSDKDLSPLERKHSLALHITIQTRGKVIP